RNELLKMTMSMIKQDATIDASIILFSWMILKSPLLAWPIGFMSAIIAKIPILPMRRSGRRVVMHNFSRILMIGLIGRTLRQFAMRRGLHNAVGSFESYLNHSMNYIEDAFSPKDTNEAS